MRFLMKLAGLMLIFLLLGGCAGTLPSNYEERAARAKELKTLVLLPASVEICLLTAGGIREKRDDWCASGQQNLESAVAETIRAKGYVVKEWQGGRKGDAELADIRPLYREVMDNIYTHAVFYPSSENPNFFPEKVKNFDYSIGSIEKLLSEQKADGLLLVYGEDEISSAGRKTLQVIRAINPFDQKGRSGVTWMEVALADSKGDILWFSSRSNEGRFDLREAASARQFTRQVLEDFPEARK